ncbi:hypothetical protein NLU13_8048 [Sarocladium strictum]|uniref:Uncharacterized protein n=1 Tax=Sarocladium strictum TaxID=5046 RepID=A0AA39L4U3_SARSR|nr:hypothetical protein NLU13_8048 [Sarocladium strictum]
MPTTEEPMQQQPMTDVEMDVVTEQPSEPQPQPEMSLRGGEEAGCSLCCGLCSCEEGCC